MNAVKSTSVAALALTLSACGDSNPMIGKWSSGAPDGNPILAVTCSTLGDVEFTDKTMVLRGVSTPVSYAHDGAKWTATGAGPQGTGLVIEMNAPGTATITALGCQLKKK